MDLINDFKINIDKITFQLKEDLKTIRTGRANPGIIENLYIEAYNGQAKLRLMEMAAISIEGPSILSIVPFDPSIITDIEKSILKSPLGLSPQVQGTKLLIKLPPLSQEQREKFIKLIHQKIEEKRVATRNQRDEVRKKIKLIFERKEISEDEKFRLEKEIDNITQKFMTEFEIIKDNKEKEIMEV